VELPRPKEESSSGVILKEMMELHIPSLLTYPDMMRNKTRNHAVTFFLFVFTDNSNPFVLGMPFMNSFSNSP
jgi:hypothetical protein